MTRCGCLRLVRLPRVYFDGVSISVGVRLALFVQLQVDVFLAVVGSCDMLFRDVAQAYADAHAESACFAASNVDWFFVHCVAPFVVSCFTVRHGRALACVDVIAGPGHSRVSAAYTPTASAAHACFEMP